MDDLINFLKDKLKNKTDNEIEDVFKRFEKNKHINKYFKETKHQGED